MGAKPIPSIQHMETFLRTVGDDRPFNTDVVWLFSGVLNHLAAQETRLEEHCGQHRVEAAQGKVFVGSPVMDEDDVVVKAANERDEWWAGKLRRILDRRSSTLDALAEIEGLIMESRVPNARRAREAGAE